MENDNLRGFCLMIKSVGRYQWLTMAVLGTINILAWPNYGILILAPKLDFQCLDHVNKSKVCYLVEEDLRRNSTDLYAMYSTLNTTYNDERKCSRFEYDHSQFEWTLTERFQLICDREWLIALSKSVYLAGYFVGSIGSGMIADRFGRKQTLLVCSVLAMIVNGISVVAPWWWLYLSMRFVLAITEMSMYLAALMIATESVRKDQRLLPKLTDSVTTDILTTLLGALSFALGNYQHFHLMQVAVAALFFVMLFFCEQESVRWLNTQAREQEALQVLGKIAEVNKTSKEEESYLMHDSDHKQTFKLLDLFGTPLIRKRTLILFCIWIPYVLCWYAITYNLGDFGKDVRYSLMISGAIEVFTTLPTALMIRSVGRSATAFALLLGAGLCCLAMAPLVGDRSHAGLTALALSGKLLLGSVSFVMYTYSAELFPTAVRATGLGACSAVGRVIAALAPQLALLNHIWPPLMVVIIGTGAITAAFLVPLLPDMTNVELPQTIEDGEKLFPRHGYSLRKAVPEIRDSDRVHDRAVGADESKASDSLSMVV